MIIVFCCKGIWAKRFALLSQRNPIRSLRERGSIIVPCNLLLVVGRGPHVARPPSHGVGQGIQLSGELRHHTPYAAHNGCKRSRPVLHTGQVARHNEAMDFITALSRHYLH